MALTLTIHRGTTLSYLYNYDLEKKFGQYGKAARVRDSFSGHNTMVHFLKVPLKTTHDRLIRSIDSITIQMRVEVEQTFVRGSSYGGIRGRPSGTAKVDTLSKRS